VQALAGNEGHMLNHQELKMPTEEAITYTFTPPPKPNWKITLSKDSNTWFQFYTVNAPNAFQRWMIKKVLGIHWIKIND